jgi:hypothetical protein
LFVFIFFFTNYLFKTFIKKSRWNQKGATPLVIGSSIQMKFLFSFFISHYFSSS